MWPNHRGGKRNPPSSNSFRGGPSHRGGPRTRGGTQQQQQQQQQHQQQAVVPAAPPAAAAPQQGEDVLRVGIDRIEFLDGGELIFNRPVAAMPPPFTFAANPANQLHSPQNTHRQLQSQRQQQPQPPQEQNWEIFNPNWAPLGHRRPSAPAPPPPVAKIPFGFFSNTLGFVEVEKVSRAKAVCATCEQTGHLARDCNSEINDRGFNGSGVCQRCNTRDHDYDSCPPRNHDVRGGDNLHYLFLFRVGKAPIESKVDITSFKEYSNAIMRPWTPAYALSRGEQFYRSYVYGDHHRGQDAMTHDPSLMNRPMANMRNQATSGNEMNGVQMTGPNNQAAFNLLDQAVQRGMNTMNSFVATFGQTPIGRAEQLKAQTEAAGRLRQEIQAQWEEEDRQRAAQLAAAEAAVAADALKRKASNTELISKQGNNKPPYGNANPKSSMPEYTKAAFKVEDDEEKVAKAEEEPVDIKAEDDGQVLIKAEEENTDREEVADAQSGARPQKRKARKEESEPSSKRARHFKDDGDDAGGDAEKPSEASRHSSNV